ncbi:MAG TPA: IS3 family transposase [Vicinamibacterales bacterium]|nr:IS3 family transposase [Vicinamibacterales bacterium]
MGQSHAAAVAEPVDGKRAGRVAAAAARSARVAAGARHPKKSHGLLRQAQRVSFAFIAAEKAQYPVRALCRALAVSPSGFYAWQDRKPSPRTIADHQLVTHVRRAYVDSRHTYGRPRLHRALRHQGVRIGERRLRRVMHLAGVRGRIRRRFRVTTDSRGVAAVSNQLCRRFHVARPNAVWAGDVTACWTREGWIYLAVLLDLASRRVVGWAVRATCDTALVLAALDLAIGTRRPAGGVIHHSDRGVQYASDAYQGLLARYGFIPSMSRVGDCWDNAPVESFFSRLKAEVETEAAWPSRAAAMQAIAAHLAFYNQQRLHSALGYRSPMTYEAELAASV